MSDTFMVFTAVGPDRPGLVEAIAAAIHDAGASLQDSRMAILGGEFALILLVKGEAAVLDVIKGSIVGLESDLGLRCIVKDTSAQQAGQHLPYSLRVSGVDRPGIVRAVSHLLANHGVNVAALESRVTNAPLSGTQMFVLDAQLQVPSRTVLGELRRVLVSMCDDENLDHVLKSGA